MAMKIIHENMTMRKTAVVTGATSGIGRDIARLLGERGYHLLLTGRNEDELSRLCDELGRKNVTAVAADLSDMKECGALYRYARQYNTEVVRLCEEEKGDFTYSYELDGTIEDKITAIVQKVYGGVGINVLPAAKKQIAQLTALGFDKCPICVAKTQYSFSDDPTKLGAPEGFEVTIKNVKVSAGAGFVVVLTGDIMTMPGLPKVPAAVNIDVDENGKITGLF